MRVIVFITQYTRKPSTSVLPFVLRRYSGKQPNKMHTLNMQELGLPIAHDNQPAPTCSHVNENSETMGVLHPGYALNLHHGARCILSRPIHTSLFQLLMATMVWSDLPIRSITQLHIGNMATSYAEGRTLTLQPILPAATASTLRHPGHLLTMLGLSKESDLLKPPPDTSICAR